MTTARPSKSLEEAEDNHSLWESLYCWEATINVGDVQITREHKGGRPYIRVFDLWSARGTWEALERERLVRPGWRPRGRKRSGKVECTAIRASFKLQGQGVWRIGYYDLDLPWREHLLSLFIDGDNPALRRARLDAHFQGMLDRVTSEFY